VVTEKSEPEKRSDQPQKPIVEQMTDLAGKAAGAMAETAVRAVAKRARKAIAKRTPKGQDVRLQDSLEQGATKKQSRKVGRKSRG
jgi:hypothetical protein